MKSFKKWIIESNPEIFEETPKWLWPAVIGGSFLTGAAMRSGGKKQDAPSIEKPAISNNIRSTEEPNRYIPKPVVSEPDVDKPLEKAPYPRVKNEPIPEREPEVQKEPEVLNSTPFDPDQEEAKNNRIEGFDDDESRVIKKFPVITDNGEYWTTMGCSYNVSINKNDSHSKVHTFKVAKIQALKNLIDSLHITPGHIRHEKLIKSYEKGDYIFVIIRVPKNGIRESIGPKSFSSFLKNQYS